jgi:hypothetical protein
LCTALASFVGHSLKNLSMKILLSIVFSLFLNFGYAQNEPKTDVIEDISTHIKTGKVKELAAYFDLTVELTIQERENSYSKAQAEIILRNFFTKYPAKSFKIMHRGASDKGGRYIIGLLTTENDTEFRTSIVLVEKNDQFYIQQLRFE